MGTLQDRAALIDPSFKYWVRRPYGRPLIQEDTFADVVTAGTAKWGILIGGGGTGAAIAQDTGFKWGGSGSAKLTTPNASGNGTELKLVQASMYEPGDLLAFEMKYAFTFGQGTTKLQFGLESRDHTNIKQARVQYTVTSGKWQFESTTADVYVDFSPAATIERSTYNGASGSPPGWGRIVIDPHSKYWHSFECVYSDGTNAYIRRWDMRGVPLCVNGSSGTPGSLILPFVYAIAMSANNEVAYTTDWCMSVIPAYMRPAYDKFGY